MPLPPRKPPLDAESDWDTHKLFVLHVLEQHETQIKDTRAELKDIGEKVDKHGEALAKLGVYVTVGAALAAGIGSAVSAFVIHALGMGH